MSAEIQATINHLEEELVQLAQEEQACREKYSKVLKLNKALKNSFDNGALFLGFPLTLLSVCLLFYFTEKPISPNLGTIIVFSIYPGFLLAMLFSGLLQKPFEYFTYRYYKLTKADQIQYDEKLNALNAKGANIRSRLYERQRALTRIRESRLIDDLENLIEKLGNGKIEKGKANEILKALEKENQDIKSNGYHHHTWVYYNNRFEKIKKYFLREFYPPPPKAAPQLITPAKPVVTESKTESKSTAKQIETPKPQNIPIKEVKSVEQPEEKAQEEIEFEMRKEDSLKAKDILLKIVWEAGFKQRLFEFSFLLITKQCPPKAADYINQLLKEEFDSLNPGNFQIHTKVYYENKLNEIQDLLGEKPITQELIKQSGGPAAINEEILNEEKKVEELIKDLPKPKPKSEGESKKFRIAPKQDFEAINTHKHNIGILGEEFVFEEEKRKLKAAGLPLYVQLVQWVSRVSDSYGYDISSMTEDGHIKYIEVKTTTGPWKEPFIMTETELNAMRTLDRYYIYRIINFNTETKRGIKVTISREQFEKHFLLEAMAYRAKPMPPDEE